MLPIASSFFFLGRLCDSADEIFFSVFHFTPCFVQYEGKGLDQGHGTPLFNLRRDGIRGSGFQRRNMKKFCVLYAGYKILAVKL